MSKAFAARMSDLSVANGVVLIAHSGRLTNAAAAQQGPIYVAPCDLYLHSLHYYIDTQFTHASSAISVGSIGSPKANVSSYNIQNAAVGAYELPMNNAAVVARLVSKGATFGLGLDAADTTGKISMVGIFVPWNPA